MRVSCGGFSLVEIVHSGPHQVHWMSQQLWLHGIVRWPWGCTGREWGHKFGVPKFSVRYTTVDHVKVCGNHLQQLTRFTTLLKYLSSLNINQSVRDKTCIPQNLTRSTMVHRDKNCGTPGKKWTYFGGDALCREWHVYHIRWQGLPWYTTCPDNV